MKNGAAKYVYGPVVSRRLGRSLGVDIVPFKTCSYDCIYCQLGATTNNTIKRQEYVPLDDVLREIELKCNPKGLIDYITISGSGEPTLYSKLKQLISEIKGFTTIPVAVITNGSLLWDQEVQHALLNADLVMPSLDAGDKETFDFVNQPHSSITFEKMVRGLISFRNKFTNQLWLEVLLLGGITSLESDLKKISAQIKLINPDRVLLNTVNRPPTKNYAYEIPAERMKKIAQIFGNNTEVITENDTSVNSSSHGATQEEIFNLIKRHPCSMESIVDSLAIKSDKARGYLDQLLNEKKIAYQLHNRKLFYQVR